MLRDLSDISPSPQGGARELSTDSSLGADVQALSTATTALRYQDSKHRHGRTRKKLSRCLESTFIGLYQASELVSATGTCWGEREREDQTTIRASEPETVLQREGARRNSSSPIVL